MPSLELRKNKSAEKNLRTVNMFDTNSQVKVVCTHARVWVAVIGPLGFRVILYMTHDSFLK